MRIWIRRVGGLLVLLAAAGLGLATPQGDRAAFDRDLRAAFEAHAARLLEHAEWCRANRLHGTRHQILQAILVLDPQHAGAHKELGHRRDRDGNWIVPPTARTAKDQNPKAAEEETQLRAELASPLRTAVLELLARHAEVLDVRHRRAVLRQVLASVPDDAVLRGILGEVRDGEQWALRETVQGRETRAALRPLVRRLLEEATREIERSEPAAREQAFELPWVGAWTLPGLRVLATTDAAEAERAATALGAARPLVEEVFGVRVRYRPGATAFLLRSAAEGRAWIGRHPNLDAAQREFLSKLEGAGIPYQGDFGAWADDPRRRVDMVVRLVLAGLLEDGLGVTMKQGLLSEGIGLYLTRELVGTRLTWFVQPSTYLRPEEDQRLRDMLLDSGTNWMNEANRLLADPQGPKLQFLLGKPVSDLATEDLLVAYVTAAYLLEGWPQELPELLRAIGKGGTPQVLLEEHLGFDVIELDARLRRWLGERR